MPACVICETEFFDPNQLSRVTCSPPCQRKHRRRKRNRKRDLQQRTEPGETQSPFVRENAQRACIICGSAILDSIQLLRITCSEPCQREHKRRKRNERERAQRKRERDLVMPL